MVSCTNCKVEINTTDKFCGNCGQGVVKVASERESFSVKLVLSFYVVYLLYAVISYAIYAESYELVTEILIESVFVLLTILFSLFDFKGILDLYNVRLINWRNLLFSFIFPVLSAGIVYFGIEKINNFLFGEGYNLFEDYAYYDNSFFWAFIFVAILPPIFEELAFRGFLFNQLQIITTSRVTIIATAVIFALVHFSYLSFLWIFPFGLVLGYLRHKYKTLWLGMMVHFIHNFIVLLLEYHYYNENYLFEF